MKVREADGSLVNPARPITLRDLMTHTSGLTYHFVDDSPLIKMYQGAKLLNAECSLEAAIDDLARFPLAFQPGTRWRYSVGIDVVARVIEVISGRPLGAFLHERLFEPLGMVDTGFRRSAGKDEPFGGDVRSSRCDLFRPDHGERTGSLGQGRQRTRRCFEVLPRRFARLFVRGGHGLFATTRDYWRFAQMLANGGELDGTRILGRKTLALMHANHIPAALLPLDVAGLPLPGYGFGLGSRVALDVAQTGAPGSVGEFGWSGAAKTHYWVDPQEELVGLFMTQSMMSFDLPELDLRALAYQAIED